MSKVTEIESKIMQLGDGEFQKFCDTFLSQKEEYGKILGLGMKSGTSKTTTGNPDTYFARDNGKYVFVAYTTQQKSIFSKIKEDIDKCLDPSKTGIQLHDIEEIVCCHTSSNLLAGDDQKLKKICSDQGIKLTIYGVDEIAQQIYKNYPNIARDFLQVSLDTNQIMSVKDFIRQYDASQTAAPLKTIFQHRETALKDLESDIRRNQVVIVHGAAGVGKTRIVIEAIQKISKEEGYRLFCVKNNNLPLLDDLVACIDKPEKYLFFIDDANELSGLNLIMNYVLKEQYQIKIILTVRDYVKSEVVRIVNEYVTPQLVEIAAFSDDEIRKFLNVNMDIQNEKYIEVIIRIAEGNPRVAYMAGKLAKETQSLAAIHDSTEVYENYYGQVIENKIGNNKNLCLTAGILAMIRAVILDQLDSLSEILKLGNISTEEFRECINILSRMEVVEIHSNKVASFSDQCMANYMLYYEFFKQKTIPFSKVLQVGFKCFRNGVMQSTNTLLNLFSKEELSDYIAEEVKTTWNKFQSDNEPCFEEFARAFHVFRPQEGFMIACNKIEEIPIEEYDGKSIDFSKGSFKSGDEILGFLTGFELTEHLVTVVEIIKNYASTSRENAIIAFGWLKNNCGIRPDSYRYGFYSSKIVFQELGKYTFENRILQKFILAYVSYALSFEFHSTEAGRGNTIRMYTIQLANDKNVSEYRSLCWNILQQLLNVKELQVEIVAVLTKYADSVRCAEDSSIVLNDKAYVENIVTSLSCSVISKALIIRNLQFGWRKHSISYKEGSDVLNTPEWKLYSLLEDKWLYSDMDYEEYENDREERLRIFSKELSEESLEEFVCRANFVVANANNGVKYALNSGISKVLEYICQDNVKAWKIFQLLMIHGHELDIHPGFIMQTLLENNDPLIVWKRLETNEFPQKNLWQFTYFDLIPEEKINSDTYQTLLGYLKDDSDRFLTHSSYRNLRFLDKFLSCDVNVYVTASRIILKKKEYSSFIVQIYFELLFHESVYRPEELMKLYLSDVSLLKEIYFYMLSQDHDMTDMRGDFLIRFFENDDTWIESFADVVIEGMQRSRDYDHYRYSALWRSDAYMHIYDIIFYRITKKIDILSEWRIANTFKAILTQEQNDKDIAHRQETWILHIVEENAQDDKVVCLFSALSESCIQLRRKAIQKFLQLNSDYHMFEKITLDPNHWGGDVCEIIPELQQRIEFLESLLPFVQSVKYLQHARRIQNRIDFWKAQIKQEETEAICRKLYK